MFDRQNGLTGIIRIKKIDILDAHRHHNVPKKRPAGCLKKTGTSIGGNVHLYVVVIDIAYGIEHIL
ncbi:MAG TPA: hypothetical protein VIE65_17745, partial [Methylobacter sp.]